MFAIYWQVTIKQGFSSLVVRIHLCVDNGRNDAGSTSARGKYMMFSGRVINFRKMQIKCISYPFEKKCGLT